MYKKICMYTKNEQRAMKKSTCIRKKGKKTNENHKEKYRKR